MLLEQSIKTDRLILKNMTLEDANARYLNWLHDEKVNQFLEVRHHLPTMGALKTFVDTMNDSSDNLLLGIYLLDATHIGNIKLGPIHSIYSRANLGLMIGDQKQWGRGYATEAINAVTGYAFAKLNLQSVRAGCYVNNEGSLKAFLKAGYIESGRRPRYWKVGDHFVDSVMLVKFSDE